MDTRIMVEQGDLLSAVRSFLRELLVRGVVEALLVPVQTGPGSISPALVTDPACLDEANPFMPLMPINNARAFSAVTGKSVPRTLGVVLRPCEIRAAVELVKLQQAAIEKVILIGVDCPGTFEGASYRTALQGHPDLFEKFFQSAAAGIDFEMEGLELRQACKICTQQVPEHVQIHMHLIGANLQESIPVSIEDSLADTLGLTKNGDGKVDPSAIEKLKSSHQRARDRAVAEIQTVMKQENGFMGVFQDCINCHNCKTACPICYCKVCLFESESLRHDPQYYFLAAHHSGAIQLMPDHVLFHLTRLVHMGLSCVGCGMCTSACPEDIPVSTVFTAVGAHVQDLFDYQPGADVFAALPLTSFSPGEWAEIGEER